jgi:hypothetical protein
MSITTEQAERLADRVEDEGGLSIVADALRDLAAERDALRAENEKLRRLVRVLLENDPDDMAADAVTVLDVWRKEAREFFDARNKARQAHMEKMRADHAAEIFAAVRSSVLGEKE